jgi:hypothetical protein
MSNAISENDERENSQNFEIIFEKVKATFSNPDKVPRERDIIERWVSSEFNITIEEAKSIVGDWISKEMVTLDGKSLNFAQNGDSND